MDSSACCNIEIDRDSSGNDVAWQTNVFDAGVCCDACTANNACQYWVLDTNSNVCWMKSSNANYATKTGTIFGTTRGVYLCCQWTLSSWPSAQL